jgi:hypothetical protein
MASPRERIEKWFPNLEPVEYEITSECTPTYNCIAWAAGCDDMWWDPVGPPGYYWPDGVPNDDSTETLIQVYSLHGFELCDSGAVESGFDKLVIYVEDGAYLHAARQTADGKWTSKLGEFEDIEHKNLAGLAGRDPAYGKPEVFMRRAVKLNSSDPLPPAPPQ